MPLLFSISFEDLYSRAGMAQLDELFVTRLRSKDTALHDRLLAARADESVLGDAACKELRNGLAPHAADFLAVLFNTSDQAQEIEKWRNELLAVYACNRKFVQGRAESALKPEEANRISPDAILNMLPLVPVDDAHFEPVYAKVVMGWLEQEKQNKAPLEMAARYAAWALHSNAGQVRHAKGVLFNQPGKFDFIQLLPLPRTCISEGA